MFSKWLGSAAERGEAIGRCCGGAAESLVMCSTGAMGVDDGDHEKEDSDKERIKIGRPNGHATRFTHHL